MTADLVAGEALPPPLESEGTTGRAHRVKTQEIVFYLSIWQHCRVGPDGSRMTPREVLNMPTCPLPFKVGCYYLHKWACRGWYWYGVTLDLGSLTSRAPTPEQFASWARSGGGGPLPFRDSQEE